MSASSLPVTLDTGTVVSVTDSTHLEVDLGDRTVTVVVPGSHAGAIPVGSGVMIFVQENSYILADVLSGGAWNWRASVGTQLPYNGATAPYGWLIQDGSSFSGATYPLLQAHLGGSTTLPNKKDRLLRGASASAAVGTTGGSTTIAEANLPAHTHTVSNIGVGTIVEGAGSSTSVYYPSGANSNTSATGSGTAYWQPWYAVHFIIKAA